jgi:hypothetical protein
VSEIIPLDAIPNQEFSVRLDGRHYTIALRECGDVMAATIARDGVQLVSGLRCAAGTPLLPYPHLVGDAGNFIFTNTVAGEIPWYENFGTTCMLIYTSAAELQAIRDE